MHCRLQRFGRATLLQLLSGLYTDFEGYFHNGYPLATSILPPCDIRWAITRRRKISSGDYPRKYHNGTCGCEDRPCSVLAADDIRAECLCAAIAGGFNTILLPEGSNIPQNIRTGSILARCIIAQPRLLSVEGFHGMEKATGI